MGIESAFQHALKEMELYNVKKSLSLKKDMPSANINELACSNKMRSVMEKDFDYFMRCLMKAGAKIEHHYFQLPVAGSEEPMIRERVYCYELYHQLRNALGDDFPYKLDGEVDKEGHPIIRPKLGPKKPDFIVHVPRKMNQNLVVIEVKPVTVKNRINELRKDLKTLRRFIDRARYYRAIMFVYGNGKHDLPESIRSEMESLQEKYGDRILLVWHRRPREKPIVYSKGELLRPADYFLYSLPPKSSKTVVR